MSAPPPAAPNGAPRRPPPPSTNPLRAVRRPPANGNPMRAPKRPGRGGPPPRPGGPNKLGGNSSQPPPPVKPPNFNVLRYQNEGWSTPMPPGGQDFPLFVSKKSLKEGQRFHVMRFAPQIRGVKQSEIDPTDQEHFPRPVTLQRRDPRQPPPGREVKEEVVEAPPVNNEETERLAQLKAQRDAQRALDDAQKAPVLKEVERKRLQQKNKEERKSATQIHYQPRTEKQKKEAEIRYEEALPWHLEDADGKNVWVGQYEAPLSDMKVALIPHPEGGGYRMLPLEKWYKFAPKRGAFQHLSIEEAEKIMSKKAAPSRWAIRDSDRDKAAKAMEESRRIMYGPTAVKQESSTFAQASRGEKMEHDDIDVSGDEFQDDDETAGFEPEKDDDSKDAKDKVRREQLGANLFGDADEKEVEKEEAAVKKEEEERKLLGKSLKKALKKRDKQFQYDSDSSNDRDPFASSESDSDSDSDEEEEEEKPDKDPNGASGASTKGANTPQGKKPAADTAKKGKSLKRPGSPLNSDSSGTESTRKNKKRKGEKPAPSASLAGSRGGTPLPSRGAGSGSDGEMSDGAGGKIKPRSKDKLGVSAKGTPTGSRAGSPIPSRPLATSPEASTSQSRPPAASTETSSPNPETSKPVTAQDIIDALPAEGISIGGLLRIFKNRVDGPGQLPKREWIQLVKANSMFGPDKLLRRKG
ncbi:Rap30/74 interaction domain-containing protein [Xylariaceae sp. FL1019]|nr:Rap30/74 interaction domain-containing protein [Xylariaceae sp. FL1019]